jgi:hypothetical protein
MVSLTDALTALEVTDWLLKGEPSNEAEFNSMFHKITGKDADGNAIESNDSADFGTTWSAVKTKYDELVAAEPMALLREERNKLLAETDWWASSDLSMSSEQTTYRQALRDITTSATSLEDVTWPTKP